MDRGRFALGSLRLTDRRPEAHQGGGLGGVGLVRKVVGTWSAREGQAPWPLVRQKGIAAPAMVWRTRRDTRTGEARIYVDITCYVYPGEAGRRAWETRGQSRRDGALSAPP